MGKSITKIMNIIAIACSVLTLICIALIVGKNYGLKIVGWYGAFIFGMPSLSMLMTVWVGHPHMDSKERAILSCRIFAVVDIVAAIAVGIIIIADSISFFLELAVLVYVFYILPVFVILLIVDLFIWSVMAGRTGLSAKIKAVLCGIGLIVVWLVFIGLWTFIFEM